MNPRLSIWYGCDPLQDKYPSISTYTYCAGNPIVLKDNDGNRILFVNGYWANGFLGSLISSNKPKQSYWVGNFASEAQNFFNDYSSISEANYIDGSSSWGGDMSGKDRYIAGYQYARQHLNALVSGLAEGEGFNMVTHSEGAAYGAGIAQFLLEQGYKVNTILHLSPDEGDEFTTPSSPFTLQLSYQGDRVTNNHTIQNADRVGEIAKGNLKMSQVHGSTKCAYIFKAASDLRTVRYRDNIGMINGKFKSWKSVLRNSVLNGTDFYRIDGCIIRNEDGSKNNN